MTETTALVTLNHPFRIGHGTIGKPLPGREVRISDKGEILVRGDMLSTATWQSGAMRQREGEWLATGDLAAQEDSGDLRFLGRKGEVIVTGSGMNVHPADLEDAMTKQPGIRGCVVVPCDTMSGPEPVAVALFSGSEAELHTIVDQANRNLADFQQIRRVLKWPDPQFPHTSTGKLLRRNVKDWACVTLSSKQQGSASAMPPGGDLLLKLIAEITGESPSLNTATSNDQLRLSEDLHLDSLGRVQLRSAIEQQLGIELEDDAIAEVTNLGDLRTLLERDEPTTPPNLTAISPPETPTLATQPAALMQREAAASEHLYPRWSWSWPVQTIRNVFIELAMRPLVWFLAAPRVVHETTELPQGPVLIIANHVTAYDGALILYALPARLRRHTASAMSGEMLLDLRRGRNQGSALLNLFAPPAYWLVTALFNVFPLPRLRGFQKSFAYAGEAMDRGYSVLVFPEGTRSLDGKLHHFRPGIGLLANQSRVPIVPVALIGLGEMRARKTRWFRSGRLEVRIGKPITLAEGEGPTQLTTQLEDALRQLQGED